jgi:hypothetical protein
MMSKSDKQRSRFQSEKIRVCDLSKRWWNSEIKKGRSTLGGEKRSGGRSEASAGVKADRQKSIRQSKRRMRNDYVQNLRGGEVWRAT